MNDLSRIEPAVAFVEDHWPDFHSHPDAEEWLIRFLQALAVIAMVTVCIVVVLGIIVYAMVWFFLSVLELISGR